MENLTVKTKFCIECSSEKDILEFYPPSRKRKTKIQKLCNTCRLRKKREKSSKEDIRNKRLADYAANKDEINRIRTEKRLEKERLNPKPSKPPKPKVIKEKKKRVFDPIKRKASVNKYHEKHKEKERQYYFDNREKIIQRTKEYSAKNREKINLQTRERRKDPLVRLRHDVSTLIRHGIKGVKIGTFVNHLPYTMLELRQYLESKFEPWMNWDNWSVYDSKTWNDNDPSTWTWQIDHIVPQSVIAYESMDSEEFRKCWAFGNLRPYSAKQNVLDGTRLPKRKKR